MWYVAVAGHVRDMTRNGQEGHKVVEELHWQCLTWCFVCYCRVVILQSLTPPCEVLLDGTLNDTSLVF